MVEWKPRDPNTDIPQGIPRLLWRFTWFFPSSNRGSLFRAVMVVRLQYVQECPQKKSAYKDHRHYSFTESVESYRYAANKAYNILRLNGRKPTCDVRWNFLNVLTLEELKKVRTFVFDYLRRRGILAWAFLEPSKDEFNNLTDRVHFHILLEGGRPAGERLKGLIREACTAYGWEEGKNYVMTMLIPYSPWAYVRYVLKECKNSTPRLFHNGGRENRIQRRYTIGKWFYETKTNLWYDVQKPWADRKGIILKTPDEKKKERKERAALTEKKPRAKKKTYYNYFKSPKQNQQIIAAAMKKRGAEAAAKAAAKKEAAGIAVEARRPAEKLYRPKSVQIIKTAWIHCYSPVVKVRREVVKVHYYPRE